MDTVRLDPATVTDADVSDLHALVAAVAAADRPRDPVPAATDLAARLRHPGNERLGFRPWQEVNGWQADVPDVVRRLGAAAG